MWHNNAEIQPIMRGIIPMYDIIGRAMDKSGAVKTEEKQRKTKQIKGVKRLLLIENYLKEYSCIFDYVLV